MKIDRNGLASLVGGCIDKVFFFSRKNNCVVISK